MRLTLLAGALVPAMFVVGAPSETATTPPITPDLAMEVTSEDTAEGCKITVKARNRGRRTTAISRDSQVRSTVGIFGGSWKKLGKSVWIYSGQSRSWTYDLDFGCKVGRQYRFLVKQFDSNRNMLNSAWHRYPTSGWEGTENFSIGDLNRFF